MAARKFSLRGHSSVSTDSIVVVWGESPSPSTHKGYKFPGLKGGYLELFKFLVITAEKSRTVSTDSVTLTGDMDGYKLELCRKSGWDDESKLHCCTLLCHTSQNSRAWWL